MRKRKSHTETLEVGNKTSEMNSVDEYDSMLRREKSVNQKLNQKKIASKQQGNTKDWKDRIEFISVQK